MSEENNDEGQDKSHAPTQRKLEKSREQGDVPYSAEITTAATYAALYLVLLTASGFIINNLMRRLGGFFSHPQEAANSLLIPGKSDFLVDMSIGVFIACAPIFLALAVAAVLSIIAQQAFVFAPTKIKPKLSRLSIIDNAKQKYGPNGIGEFVKSFVKMFAIMAILFIAFKDRFLALPFLASLPAQAFGQIMFREAVLFLGLTTIVAVAIAVADFPWKRHQHEKKLMMTTEELKKESKEMEGDPTLKSERRRRAQEIATNKMMNDVPDANVVVVNPTHYAVALKWNQDEGGAPVVVAKGVDEIAARIRAVASESGVPIKRDPPTARSIYALVDIGKEIEREHYAAVAAAIHYADEIREKMRNKVEL